MIFIQIQIGGLEAYLSLKGKKKQTNFFLMIIFKKIKFLFLYFQKHNEMSKNRLWVELCLFLKITKGIFTKNKESLKSDLWWHLNQVDPIQLFFSNLNKKLRFE